MSEAKPKTQEQIDFDTKLAAAKAKREDADDVNGQDQWSPLDGRLETDAGLADHGAMAKGYAAKAKVCNKNKRSKDEELRGILMMQLKDMGEEASTKEGSADNHCHITCDEDQALADMNKLYNSLNSSSNHACANLGEFKDDSRLQILEAMQATLKYTSFSFLHRACQGTNNCNPYDATVPEDLMACSGLMQGAPFFYDSDLEAVGAHLAGRQGSPKSDSPASRGHCANFYPTGTVAPGRGKELYVNVCYNASQGEVGALLTKGAAGGEDAVYVGVKWVKANRMEVAKYTTLKDLHADIRRQKQNILSVNRKMIALQQSLIGLRPMDGMDDATNNDPAALLQNMRLFVKRSTNRVRRGMAKRGAKYADKKEDDELRYSLFGKRNALQYEARRRVGHGRSRSRKSKSKSRKSSKGRKSKGRSK
jgi:hypothetical protein